MIAAGPKLELQPSEAILMHLPRGGSVLFAALVAVGCGRAPASPTPSPSTPAGAVPGAHTGPTAIVFVDATPPAGSVVACGPTVAACAGRIRVGLRLDSPHGGPALWTDVTLHATNRIACVRGRAPGPMLEAGRPQTVEIVLDQTDPACGLPLTITHMAAVVEGVVQVASRQEWSIAYELRP